LQVKESASPEVIRGAYRQLAQKYHPDKFAGGREDAEKVMRIINSAYAVLSNPYKRAEYDELLAARRTDKSATPNQTSDDPFGKPRQTESSPVADPLRSRFGFGRKFWKAGSISFLLVTLVLTISVFADESPAKEIDPFAIILLGGL